MYVQLVEYLDKNYLFRGDHNWFRKGKSTAKYRRNYNRNQLVKIRCNWIFHDLSKAFDSVSRLRLIIKLCLMGIRSLAPKRFKSYLGNRLQSVETTES